MWGIRTQYRLHIAQSKVARPKTYWNTFVSQIMLLTYPCRKFDIWTSSFSREQWTVIHHYRYEIITSCPLLFDSDITLPCLENSTPPQTPVVHVFLLFGAVVECGIAIRIDDNSLSVHRALGERLSRRSEALRTPHSSSLHFRQCAVVDAAAQSFRHPQIGPINRLNRPQWIVRLDSNAYRDWLIGE